MKILYYLMFFTTVFGLQPPKPCQLKKFDAGYVCVCSDNYCDTLNVPKLSNINELLLVTSTRSGQRFNFTLLEFHKNDDDDVDDDNSQPHTKSKTFLNINQNILHQEVVGFGGSITGAVSYILNKLSTNLRECIYKSYYTDDDGLGYTLMRMPIGGCDFDLEPWAYNEFPENDVNLSNFTELHPKDILRTDLIKQFINVSQNFDIKIVGVTWSSPRWMKEKGDWAGAYDNRLKIEYYQTWADYHVKWLDLMHATEIPISAISTGNEPYFAQFTPFMGLNWNSTDQATWITKHLGPALKNSKHSDVDIHTFDDNRDILLSWLNDMDNNDDVMNYITAFGVHGYFDKVTSPNILDSTKLQYPNKTILYTEMCFGVTGPISTTGPILGSWTHFEELTDMLMEILSHNVNGFLDWNMILNIHGGPNYINNVVDAMIVANEDFTEIYKQPMFYAAAHFTKFIPPGSKRVETNISGDNVDDLSALTFLRPDRQVAAIFYNRHEQNTIFLQINDQSKGIANIQIPPKSLNTLIYSI